MRPRFSIRFVFAAILMFAALALFLERSIHNPLAQLQSANAQLIPVGYSDIGFCISYPAVDGADDIEMVSLERDNCSERPFAMLGRLANLKRLDLRGNFESEWLECLQSCSELTTLVMHGDADAKHLSTIKNIESLKSVVLSRCIAPTDAKMQFVNSRPDIEFDCNDYP